MGAKRGTQNDVYFKNEGKKTLNIYMSFISQNKTIKIGLASSILIYQIYQQQKKQQQFQMWEMNVFIFWFQAVEAVV